MTCCVAIPFERRSVIIAADTQASGEGDCASTARKLYQGSNGSILTGAGYASELAQAADAWVRGDANLDALCTHLRSRRRECATDFIYVGREGLVEVDCGGAVTRGRFPFTATGSGRAYALGYLGATWRRGMTEREARDLARACLRFVSKCDPGVAAPFDVEVWRP